MSSLQEKTKAPYYPSIFYQTTQTRFGAVETDYPDLYKQPFTDKTIIQVDTLSCLKSMWGDSVFQSRDLTYKLVSGNCSNETFRKLLASYYAKHKGFTDYIDNVFYFGDKDSGLVNRIISPVRTAIAEKTTEVLSTIESSGGKVVMLTHDYVYATYRHNNLPDLDMMTVIK